MTDSTFEKVEELGDSGKGVQESCEILGKVGWTFGKEGK